MYKVNYKMRITRIFLVYFSGYSKPFTLRMVSDPDEFSLTTDYMNRGFHLQYSQIPCKLAG